MSEKEIESLINGYKRDFFSKTGRGLNIRIAKKSESICNVRGKLSETQLFDLFSEFSGFTKDTIISINRKPQIVEMRSTLMFILFENGMSLSAIGRMLNKDHSTVIYAIRRIKEKFDNDGFSYNFLERTMNYIKEAIELKRVDKNVTPLLT